MQVPLAFVDGRGTMPRGINTFMYILEDPSQGLWSHNELLVGSD